MYFKSLIGHEKKKLPKKSLRFFIRLERVKRRTILI